MSPDHRAVIVMAKRPAAGSTKTRMSPTLSPQQAADLYEGLLLDTLGFLCTRADCTTIIAIDSPSSAEYFETIAPGTAQVLQLGDDLGDRLASVLAKALELGFAQVFAISSDSPDLPSGHLDDAFAAIDRDDVDLVIGPTEDGGYYLIGCKRPWPEVTSEVEMSTDRVVADTLAVADRLGASVYQAPTWYDIDTPDDLARLQHDDADSATPNTLNILAGL